jgi:23S rRNA (adenine-N6)-dimethyltransferase
MPEKYLVLKHSQNFLRSPALVTRLIRTKTEFTNKDKVIDIGAGNGAIALALANEVNEVWSYEIDDEYFRELEARVTGLNIKLFKMNFLQADLSKLGDYKVFSNIPFFLTAEIVRKLFLDSNNAPQEAFIFMQREAAERFMGAPFQKESLLSILIKAFWDLKIVHTFNADDFEPLPAVQVVLVKFSRIAENKMDWNKRQKFFDFVSYVLNLRKPKLKNSLLSLFTFTQLQILGKTIGINLQAAPSTLQARDWQKLFNSYLRLVEPIKQGACKGAYDHLLLHQVKLNQFRNNLWT